jgi:hypothetical protein
MKTHRLVIAGIGDGTMIGDKERWNSVKELIQEMHKQIMSLKEDNDEGLERADLAAIFETHKRLVSGLHGVTDSLLD